MAHIPNHGLHSKLGCATFATILCLHEHFELSQKTKKPANIEFAGF
jgi:hypothetical protein